MPKALVLCFFLFFFATQSLSAQSRGGMIQGTLTQTSYIKKDIVYNDTATGEMVIKPATIRKTLPVIGAQVQLNATPYKTFTDTSGFYFMQGLPRGIFDITYSAKGFKSEVFRRVFIKNDTISEIDIRLYPILSSAEEEQVWVSRYPAPLRYISGKTSTINLQTLPVDPFLQGPLNSLGKASLDWQKEAVVLREEEGMSSLKATQALMVYDNIKVSTPVQNRMPVWLLDPFWIKQTDVAYGAQSALLGSGAEGGAVFMVPKKVFENATRVQVQGGFYSQPSRQSWENRQGLPVQKGFMISRTQNLGQINSYGSLSITQDEGYLAESQSNKWRLFSYSDYRFGSGNRLSLTAAVYQAQEDMFPAWKSYFNATERYLDEPDPAKERQWFLAPKLNLQLSRVTNLELGGSYMNTKNLSYYGAAFSGEQQALHGQLLLDFGYGYHLLGGFEAIRNAMDSDTFGSHEDLLGALFIQNENPLAGPVRVTYGARFDLVALQGESVSGEFSPKVGFVLPVGETSTFRANYNTGFRLPSLYQRYATLSGQGFQIEPNPGLKTQYTTTTELGYNFNFMQPINLPAGLELTNFKLDANFYYSTLNNRVELGLNNGSGIAYQNAGEAALWGLELESEWTMWHELVGLAWGYHFTKPEDGLYYRHRHQFSVALSVNREPFSAILSCRYQSAYASTNPVLTAIYQSAGSSQADVRLSALLIDARFSAKLSNNLSLNLDGYNLLNDTWLESPAKLGRLRYVQVGADLRF